MIAIEKIKNKYRCLSDHLNEKSRRIWAATESESYGRGGITIVHNATGIDHKTIRKGVKEITTGSAISDRIRKEGGGRKKYRETEKTILKDLEALVEPTTRGDPESPLRWTCKSTYKLAEVLKVNNGYKISQRTVYNLLTFLKYSLQANKKTKEGSNHPDRNAQFEHISEQVKSFHNSKCPAISVDTKKKENVGNFKNNGREYSKHGKPLEVNGHDFPDKNLGKVAPYGVYDIGNNKGWVSVGISGDTASFAVNTIRAWWYQMGISTYSKAKKILITADCGGSNGYRVKLWKIELQKLATELNKAIQVCHFPPGTSKWNKIEHRMFSYISKNWRGQPLMTRETVVNLIANTKTKTGLTIKAILDNNQYETGLVISNAEMKNINIKPEDFHGEWNYTIAPVSTSRNREVINT